VDVGRREVPSCGIEVDIVVGESAEIMVALYQALVWEEVCDAFVIEGISKGGSVKEEGKPVEGKAGIIDILLRCKGGEGEGKV
jgi:hypothetical protein